MYLCLIAFVITFLVCRKYKSDVLNGVLLFYIAASICGVITRHTLYLDAYDTFFSSIFLCVILFLCISPVIVYGKHENYHNVVYLLNNQRFLLLSYSLIVLQLFSILFFAKEDYAMLARGDFSQIRSEILAAGRGTGSIFRTVAGVASFFYCYNILLFFYSLSFRNDKKWFLYLLIISSASRIFHSLTYMGRDGILFWVFSFVFTFIVFRQYLKPEAIRLIKRIALIILAFALLLLIAISISRFGESDSGVFLSLIDYFGQPINNFGMLFDRFHDYRGLNKVFPLLYGETGASGAEVLASVDDFYLKYGIASNAFYTFVGSFYKAIGPIFTLLIALIYSSYMSKRMRRKYLNLPTLILLMIIMQIVIHNYFYWAYYIRVANLYLFTTPIFLAFCRKSSAKVLITK